jgi:selenocysteine-specific elongation factor
MKHIIVGTAGHIDHGKSALVLALTGTDPDRWEEEKRRGITIDLGFAHLDLPATAGGPASAGLDAVRLGFVDVPGHERFVRNMLAGVGGIDLVLLAIAADESIKPQTREHFDICRLLDIRRGLTVLTKTDLVEADMVELVRLEVEEFLRGSFLDPSPIVPVSSKTGAGLDRLREELQRLAATVPAKDATQIIRLPVDRAFAMKGFGAVVTGTLVSGSVHRDEELELFPARRRVRVRGLQVHGQSVEEALAGQRTAVNLAGIDVAELGRGMVLAAPHRFEPTRRADVCLALLPSARPLKDGARVHFHQGTAETIAEVRLLDTAELQPGATAYAQLHLQSPFLLLAEDRFIIRRFSPVMTIGGGRILDPQPAKHKRRDPTTRAFLDTLAGNNRAAILEALVAQDPAGVVDASRLIGRTGWREADLRSTLSALVAAGRLRQLADAPLTVAPVARLEQLSSQVVQTVEEFHRREPLLEGISKEELKERLFARVPELLFLRVLADLEQQGLLEVAGDVVKRGGRAVTLSREEQEARESIEQAFARAGLVTPAVREVLTQLKIEPGRAQKILHLLVRDKVLVKVSEELVFHASALGRLAELLRHYKQENSERLSVMEFKQLTQVTRKYAIPLLEYLDRERWTRRVGDERLILL